MVKILFLVIGLLIAFTKVKIELNKWIDRKSQLKFHSIGFSIVFIIMFIPFYFSGFNVSLIAISILSYWNMFEVYGNISHGQDWLYVGSNAETDKLLRRFKNFKTVKLLLHIVTIISVLLLLAI